MWVMTRGGGESSQILMYSDGRTKSVCCLSGVECGGKEGARMTCRVFRTKLLEGRNSSHCVGKFEGDTE